MSVAFDSTANAGGYSAASSLSWNHTNVGTTDLYLRVTDSRTTLFGDTDITALTYDGVSLLANVVGEVFATDFQDVLPGVARIYELKNPNTGTKAVSMTFTTQSYGFGCGSLMYTGVEQTGASSGTAVTGAGNSSTPSVTVTGTTSGNMVSDCEANELFFGPPTPAGNQTVRYSGEGSGGQQGAAQDAAAGGDITMSWAIGAPGNLSWLLVAAEILASGSAPAAAVIPMRRVLSHYQLAA